jgi:putative sterol carrier protein
VKGPGPFSLNPEVAQRTHSNCDSTVLASLHNIKDMICGCLISIEVVSVAQRTHSNCDSTVLASLHNIKDMICGCAIINKYLVPF